eukprot:TRINITY_DN12460_c0_g1_i1.p1 TRINITY_DN12460_c0_g1~~TRINITY_DN12460_c0_g1_i1.p1  ORF type:complete len:968 (-),score=127.20 TRINITY_DN12460_c0_g1_i1:63-2966(-)
MKRTPHKNLSSNDAEASHPFPRQSRQLSFSSLLLRLFIIILVVIVTWRSAQTFLNRQTQKNLEVNDLCTSEHDTFEGVDMTLVRDKICSMDDEPYQFDKFIWLVTDGFPIKYATFVEEVLESHLITYLVDIPGPKYSHAIYTSFLTGLLPMNLPGEPIIGDSLLKSLVRSDYKLHYVGPEWSFLAMNGKENYESLFNKIELEFESLLADYEHAYPFFFETDEAYSRLEQTLKDLKKKDTSLISHSGVIDHRQHGEFRTGKFSQTRRIARRCGNDFRYIKDWIDQNPEYLFIVSSDHGVDEMTAAGYRMHGESAQGNEGFFMFYNPRLRTVSEKQRIDIVDVCPTIAKYLKGVDIPANAIGLPRNIFHGDRGNLSTLQVSEQALLQKLIPSRVRNLRRGPHHRRVEELIRGNTDPNDLTSIRKSVDGLLESFKNDLYENILQVSTATLASCLLACGLTLAAIFWRYNRETSLQLIRSPKRYSIFLLELFGLSIVYLGFYLPAFALSFLWKRIHNMGLPYNIWSSLVGLLILYYLFDRIAKSRPVGRDDDKTASYELFHAREAARLVFMNEVVQTTLHTLAQFNSRVDMKFGEIFYGPVFTGVAYLLAIASLVVFFVNYRLQGAHVDPWPKLIGSGGSLSTAPSPTNWRSSFRKLISLRLLLWLIIFFCLVIFEQFDSWGSRILRFSSGAFFVYAGCSLLIILSIFNIRLPFFGPNSLLDTLPPLNMIVFLLWVQPTSYRIYLLILNSQLLCLVCPAIEHIFLLGRYQRVSLENEHSLDHSRTSEGCPAARDETLRAAAIGYLIACGFFAFSGVSLDLTNIDVHPIAGAIGLVGFDVYPNLSGFLMAFHKYCTFVVLMIYLVFLRGKIDSDFDGSGIGKDGARSNVGGLMRTMLTSSVLDMPNLMLLFMFGCSVMGFNFLIRCFSMLHGIQESASTIGLAAFLVVSYNGLSLARDLFYDTERVTVPNIF